MRGSINFFGPKREGEDEEAKESKGFFNKSNGSIRFRMKLGNPRVVLKKENYLCREPIHILPNTQNLCRIISQRKALLASEIKFLFKKRCNIWYVVIGIFTPLALHRTNRVISENLYYRYI